MRHWLVLILMLVSTPVWAATYHVRTGGNAGATCGSAVTNNDANAFNSIGKAIRDCGGAGQTIQVHTGLYDEAFDNNTFHRNGGSTSGTFPGGSSGNPFVIEGAPGETVEIRPSQSYGGGVVFNNTGASWVTMRRLIMDGRNQTGGPWKVQIPSTHWTLEDVEVRNGVFTGISMGDDSGSRSCDNSCFHTFIRVNSHHACEHGCSQNQLSLSHGAYVACSDNTFIGGEYHHNAHGIQSYCDPGGSIPGNPDRNTFNGVKFYNNSSVGIGLYFGTGLKVTNSLAYNNGGAGIWAQSGSTVAYGNTLANNSGAGLSCNQTNTADTKNNLSVANGGSEFEDCNNASGNGNLASNDTSLFFVSAVGGDYHISSAGSPAINAGVTLGAPYNTDLEGNTRAAGQYTSGAYQFGAAPPPPQPPPPEAKYTFDEGTGTTAADSSGHSHPCTLNSAGWTSPGIVGTSALNADGSRWCEATGTSALRPSTEFGLSVRFRSPTLQDCDLVSMGDSYVVRVTPNGNLATFYYNGFAWPIITTSGLNVTNGVNHHIAATKDATGLRIWLDGAQVAFLSTTGTIDYTLGSNLNIGRHGNGDTTFNCDGVIDQVYVITSALTQAGVDNLFNESVANLGVTQTHQRYSVAHVAEGTWIGAEDTDQPLLITTPWGVRWSLHNATGATLTESYRPFCRIKPFTTGIWGSWTELTNSFGSFGLRYLTDNAVNVGDPTTPLLTLDGFTGVAGKYLADAVGPVSDASRKITFTNGQHAELEARMEAGSPVAAGDMIQCRPYHEAGSVLSGGYGTDDVNIKTLTLQGLNAPSAVRLGGTVQGGRFQ